MAYTPRSYRHAPIHIKSSLAMAASTSSTNVVEKMIKSGASGTAMLCRDTDSGDMSVKKQIKCKSQREVEHAKSEAAFLEDLRSTNVIDFKSFEQPNRREVNIYMEYADGGDLGDEIDARAKRGDHYTEQELLERFADCVKAISTMHAKGVVHRDIKPQNIFLHGDRAKVGDFGIARSCSKNGRVRTPVGTPLYLDPQRCEGRDYGQKADMWSLGCVLYEMAALQPAFTARSMGELKRKVLRGNIDYSRIPGHYSSEITTIIKNLLEVKEERRASVGDLLRNPMIRKTIHERDLLKISQSSSSSIEDTIQEERSSDEDMVDGGDSPTISALVIDVAPTPLPVPTPSQARSRPSPAPSRRKSQTPPLRRRKSHTPPHRRDLAPPALAPVQRIKTPECIRQEVAQRRVYGSARDRARSHSPYPNRRNMNSNGNGNDNNSANMHHGYSRSDRRGDDRSPLASRTNSAGRLRSKPSSSEPVSPHMSPLGSRRSEYKQMKSNLQFERDHLTPKAGRSHLQVGPSTSRALQNALGHLSDNQARKDFSLLPSIGSR